MQRQSITVDVNDVKIYVSSHYDSPSLSRHSISSTNNESKELDYKNQTEISPIEKQEVINLCTEKPVTIPIQDTNNDNKIDVTKSANDVVTIKNECNNSANRQSSVKKKDTAHICDVL